jgi:DNA ligase (NAD+)
VARGLLRESLRLSLDGVPGEIGLEQIRKTVLAIPGVAGIHHIHVWAISSTENAMTAHLVLRDGTTRGQEQEIKSTLRNADEVARLDVRVGDTVIVSRAGDVIPQIVSVLINLRPVSAIPFAMPSHCPVDNSFVIRDGVAYRCSNSECGARLREGLYHFVSRGAFDIRGLGPAILDRFFEEGLITDAADIFSLTTGDISSLPRFGTKSADNIVREIAAKRHITAPRFFYALGILHVGVETARILSDALARRISKKNISPTQLGHAVEAYTVEELQQLSDIGPVVAASIFGWFSRERNRIFLQKLSDAGVSVLFESSSATQQTVSGLSFVLTGTLSSLTRDQARDRIRQSGGTVTGSVSRHTAYLVAGDNPGSKYQEAVRLGIPILTEDDFLSLLKGS